MKAILTVIAICVYTFHTLAQIPQPALVGYWHNWNAPPASYINLSNIDSRFNVIDIAFAIPAPGTDYLMEFIPTQANVAELQADIALLQSQNRKVLISIGGATAPIHLDNTIERNAFISSMMNIINTYGFDGLDIDLEGSSLTVSGGSITNPTDSTQIHLIAAMQAIMQQYRTSFNRKMLLTAAPETAFVQGGQSAFGGIWGGYLPVLHALRDSIDLLHVQLYNSGSMYGLDGVIYTQGNADFIVSQTEAVIRGFQTAGGLFTGFPAAKIAVGLPACNLAAGGGYAEPEVVEAALNYLLGNGPQPGSYTLIDPSAYPDLGGMMTWSINWDAAESCNGTYSYANTFSAIFSEVTTANANRSHNLQLYPNPISSGQKLQINQKPNEKAFIQILNTTGRLQWEGNTTEFEALNNLDFLPPGLYLLKCENQAVRFIKQNP